MSRLPVEPDSARDEEFGSVFTCGFVDGLVQEQRIAHGAVKGAIEDVGEGFALSSSKGG